MPKIRIIIHSGERFGHQKASYTLMKRLRELGFEGQFEILYDDLYPELVAAHNYRTHIAESLPRSRMNIMSQSLEMQHNIYLDKLSSYMKQLLPKFPIEYERIDNILKNIFIDNSTKIKLIDDILSQAINTLETELRVIQDSYNESRTSLITIFEAEIVKKKILSCTQVM